MSGCSGDQKCPACGGRLYTYSDYKPVDCSSGECLHCGFAYQTQYYRMTLKEVNAQRADRDDTGGGNYYLPLKKLAEIKPAFTKYFGELKELNASKP